MGIYVNPDNIDFQRAINSQIYVDKSGLIELTNAKLFTEQQFICVSRPRRFGKSMAANMLTAYYSRGCDSRKMFSELKIAKSADFEKHLNKYNVIHINMVDFLDRSKTMDEMLDYLRRRLLHELKKGFSDVDCFDWDNLQSVLGEIYTDKRIAFIFIIDEWDCIFRIHKNDSDAQTKYLDFLRNLLKDQSYVALAYMTGILPIKKYGEHSALNMFTEVSMTNPREYAEYTGFTEDEVKGLCEKYNMPFDETKRWYDGYNLKGIATYNPRSVVMSMTGHDFDSYWTSTETYEALKVYIDMNFDGLKDDVLSMIAGEKVPVNTGSFTNDMTTFRTEDDVLTLLIHLGYLGYDSNEKCVFIPNNEIRSEYVNAVSVSDWGEVSQALKNSADILNAIWQRRPEQVAEGIRQAHFETSHIQYNDENALSYTISLALYAARNFYTVHRELAGGKGFADMVYIPRKKYPEKPALVVELKWDKSAAGAISQIKEKEYCQSLEEYQGNLLLVGINYDVKTKEHSCVIEEFVK